MRVDHRHTDCVALNIPISVVAVISAHGFTDCVAEHVSVRISDTSSHDVPHSVSVHVTDNRSLSYD